MGLLFNPLNGELEMGQVASQVPFDNTIFDSYGVTPATQVQEAVDSLITAMATTFGDVYASIPTAHNQLTDLTADDHTQYALLAGRSGGQTLPLKFPSTTPFLIATVLPLPRKYKKR